MNDQIDRMVSLVTEEADALRVRGEALRQLDPAIIARALITFGSERGAASWLTSTGIASLDGNSPVDLARTPQGRSRVETVLNAIDHGIVL